MKKLPKSLVNMLYNLHKRLWMQGTSSIGTINTGTLEIYEAGVRVADILGYDVTHYKEYVDIYNLRRKEDKE